MIGQEHRDAVRNETIVSIAINALLPTAIIWALGVTPPPTFGGEHGLWQGMAKASGLATLLMTAVVTALIRARVRKRAELSLALVDLPGLARVLPGNLPARSVAMAVVALTVLLPVGTLAAAVLEILPLDVGGFVAFNLLFGTLVGMTMTPFVVLRAMADRTGA